ncbi:transposase [Candidatus Kaiserbacteria bacterium]|nr:transposase [Candidatus Kaiserbacteria bacterium]
MARRISFGVDEWYHCYNRGVDKREIFGSEDDAKRFLMHLYLCNGSKPVALYDIEKPSLPKAYAEDRGSALVDIGAFCLMPNHYHLLIREVSEGGITSFMRKLGTAYTMYFNLKYERVGHLFSGPFRARHIANERYFQYVIQYIHCNPAELYEPGWKSGKVKNLTVLEKKLVEYPFSSLVSFERKSTNPILSREIFEMTHREPLSRMLKYCHEYYADISNDKFER